MVANSNAPLLSFEMYIMKTNNRFLKKCTNSSHNLLPISYLIPPETPHQQKEYPIIGSPAGYV